MLFFYSSPENNGTRAKKNGSEDSDSSVEVIKTWNTRRTRGDEGKTMSIISSSASEILLCLIST